VDNVRNCDSMLSHTATTDIQDNTNTIHALREIPVFERREPFRVLDRSATVIGILEFLHILIWSSEQKTFCGAATN
jgi:hypothetical protein